MMAGVPVAVSTLVGMKSEFGPFQAKLVFTPTVEGVTNVIQFLKSMDSVTRNALVYEQHVVFRKNFLFIRTLESMHTFVTSSDVEHS